MSKSVSESNHQPLLEPTKKQSSNQSAKLSHLDADGDIHMVDVGHKKVTTREAVAQGYVIFPKDIIPRLKRRMVWLKKAVLLRRHI